VKRLLCFLMILLILISLASVGASQEIRIEISVVLSPKVEALPATFIPSRPIPVGSQKALKIYSIPERKVIVSPPPAIHYPFVFEEIQTLVNERAFFYFQPRVDFFSFQKASLISNKCMIEKRASILFPFLAEEKNIEFVWRETEFVIYQQPVILPRMSRRFDASRLKRINVLPERTEPELTTSEKLIKVPVPNPLDVKPSRGLGWVIVSEKPMLTEKSIVLMKTLRAEKPFLTVNQKLSYIASAEKKGVIEPCKVSPHPQVEEFERRPPEKLTVPLTFFSVGLSTRGLDFEMGSVGFETRGGHIFFALSYPSGQMLLNSMNGLELSKDFGSLTVGVSVVRIGNSPRLLPKLELFNVLGPIKLSFETGLDFQGYKSRFGVSSGNLTLRYEQDHFSLTLERTSLLWNKRLIGVSFHYAVGEIKVTQFLGKDRLGFSLEVPVFGSEVALLISVAEKLELVECRWNMMSSWK